jgi:hypothetical protein
MQQNRAGENQPIPFRNDRYFCVNGVWYFESRGGKQIGPFISKKEMEAELMMFIREKTLLGNFQQNTD